MREWLNEARKSKGLTLRSLGERIGVSEAYMSLIESGQKKKRMDLRTLAAIAEATGAGVFELMEKELDYERRESVC